MKKKLIKYAIVILILIVIVLISLIVHNNNFHIVKDVNYEIYYKQDAPLIEKRGYKLSKNNDCTIVEIGMGKQINTDYGIGLTEIKIINSDLHIVVEEIEYMFEVEFIGETYPSLSICIYDEFDGIVVKNKNGLKYTELGVNN